MLASAARHPGAIFQGNSCNLLVDRLFFIISMREIYDGVKYIIENELFDTLLPTGERFSMRVQEDLPGSIPREPDIACVDCDKLIFPLQLRHWKPGDEFQPLGMGGRHQKLQDFFNNNKISRFEKERVWLLESGGELVWIVGMRLDERYKLTENTRRIATFTISS
jgi:tRNA(Ile)-lysidine synthase